MIVKSSSGEMAEMITKSEATNKIENLKVNGAGVDPRPFSSY